jgi:hypothetical protein
MASLFASWAGTAVALDSAIKITRPPTQESEKQKDDKLLALHGRLALEDNPAHDWMKGQKRIPGLTKVHRQ